MKLLALDTSSVACTVAVQSDGQLIERHEVQPREHTRLLIPMIESAMQEAGLTAADLDGVVLGNGPGSFIGMRIATSVAQGMAHAAGLHIAPVSSLAAVADEVFASTSAAHVLVAQDAHMDEVYLGIYRRGSENRCDALTERLHDQSRIDSIDEFSGAIAAGAGWHRYPDLLDANRQHFDSVSEVQYPSAKFLLATGRDAFASGRAVSPEAVTPAYLRQEVAAKIPTSG